MSIILQNVHIVNRHSHRACGSTVSDCLRSVSLEGGGSENSPRFVRYPSRRAWATSASHVPPPPARGSLPPPLRAARTPSPVYFRAPSSRNNRRPAASFLREHRFFETVSTIFVHIRVDLFKICAYCKGLFTSFCRIHPQIPVDRWRIVCYNKGTKLATVPALA